MTLTADERRRSTAQERREHVISVLSRHLDPLDPDSTVGRFRSLVEQHDAKEGGLPRRVLMSGDIDGLVSAMMLRKATDWKVIGVILGSEILLLHPDVLDVETALRSPLFGVDVYSSLFPNASNHPVFWGTRNPVHAGPQGLGIAAAYDAEVRHRAETHVVLNASLWAGIEGSRLSQGDYSVITSARYKYPLGTAQLLLAVLELIGRSPKMFDRSYLPWLVADCDGGLDTIRTYPWNVSMWWSALAAAVGPASLSENLYRIASTQTPDAFLNVTNHLRAEVPDVAEHLSNAWNLRTVSLETFEVVTGWISGISGWPDPFLGGVKGLKNWQRTEHKRGRLVLNERPVFLSAKTPDEAFYWHLRAALEAIYMNYLTFGDKSIMGWMLPDPL